MGVNLHRFWYYNATSDHCSNGMVLYHGHLHSYKAIATWELLMPPACPVVRRVRCYRGVLFNFSRCHGLDPWSLTLHGQLGTRTVTIPRASRGHS